MNSNPFEPPRSVSHPKTSSRSNAARIAFRCIGGLLFFGSYWPAKLAWYFLEQDYLHIWARESYIYDAEISGFGAISNNQMIIVGIVMTMLIWALAVTFLFLSRRW